MKNKANGPADWLVTEMLQCLLMETENEVLRSQTSSLKSDCAASAHMPF